ncbi:MAG: L-threonylcarbamoyladenylate synthase [Gemmatimonadota bacterium]
MTTYRIDATHPDPDLIAAAAAVIRGGGLVAFPTETVYGLGANALDAEAVGRIFAAKGRPDYNPLIAHCADTDAARSYSRIWPAAAERLAGAFWPGPLTLVVPKREIVPDIVTAGLRTVALRVPGHRVARALLDAAGVPIAAPSANRSTELSPTLAAHVLKGLAGRVDMVLDAGESALGIESTVVDLSRDTPTLLRPGTLDIEEIENALGQQLASPGGYEGPTSRPSPGMLARHYAPRAELIIVPAGAGGRLSECGGAAAREGRTVGALLLSIPGEGAAVDHVVRMPDEPSGYARALYATLHRLDDLGCDLILVEAVPVGPRWAGVRDRISRATQAG